MEIVTLLIRAGFDVNTRDSVRHTYMVSHFCEVISVSLHMSVITQDGDSALMKAAREGWTVVISLLLKAAANTDLQNEVKCV